MAVERLDVIIDVKGADKGATEVKAVAEQMTHAEHAAVDLGKAEASLEGIFAALTAQGKAQGASLQELGGQSTHLAGILATLAAQGKVQSASLREMSIQGASLASIDRTLASVMSALTTEIHGQRAQMTALERTVEETTRTTHVATDAVEEHERKMASMRDVIVVLQGAYGALRTAIRFVSEAWDTAKGGAALEDITRSSERLGATSARIEEWQAALAGTVSDDFIRKQFTTARAMGLTSDQFSRMLPGVRAVSNVMGVDLKEALDRAVRGTAKMEIEILDELGVLVKINPAVAKYAAEHGIAANKLTEVQKQAAFAEAVISSLNEKMAAAPVAAYADQFARLDARIEDVTNRLKKWLASDVVGAWLDILDGKSPSFARPTESRSVQGERQLRALTQELLGVTAQIEALDKSGPQAFGMFSVSTDSLGLRKRQLELDKQVRDLAIGVAQARLGEAQATDKLAAAEAARRTAADAADKAAAERQKRREAAEREAAKAAKERRRFAGLSGGAAALELLNKVDGTGIPGAGPGRDLNPELDPLFATDEEKRKARMAEMDAEFAAAERAVKAFDATALGRLRTGIRGFATEVTDTSAIMLSGLSTLTQGFAGFFHQITLGAGNAGKNFRQMAGEVLSSLSLQAFGYGTLALAIAPLAGVLSLGIAGGAIATAGLGLMGAGVALGLSARALGAGGGGGSAIGAGASGAAGANRGREVDTSRPVQVSGTIVLNLDGQPMLSQMIRLNGERGRGQSAFAVAR